MENANKVGEAIGRIVRKIVIGGSLIIVGMAANAEFNRPTVAAPIVQVAKPAVHHAKHKRHHVKHGVSLARRVAVLEKKVATLENNQLTVDVD